MLEFYRKKYHKDNFQYIVIDDLGKVVETENSIFSLSKHTLLQDIHPFFEILNSLVSLKQESFEFSCVNLDIDNKSFVTDITIHTEKDNENLIIIENLTNHYNNYQLTAQTRNESTINSQILELKNQYLKEKEIFKDNFIANFSHQLRNPISASIIFSNLLVDSNLNEEQKNYLDIVVSANKDLKNRIEDILDISKIQYGKLTLVEKVFDLKQLIDDIISGYRHLATLKGLDFKIDIDEKLPDFIEGDQYRFKQIIGNILNNAISFTKKGTISLHVSLNYKRANKASIHIEITDTGIGIAPEHMDSIFERFTKIDAAMHDKKSTGLGLAIVKYIISEMGGNINVESNVGKGSKFICNVSFKISNYNKNLKKELLTTNQEHKLDNKYTLLLVEDTELMQLSILKILAATGNFYLNIVGKEKDVLPSLVNQNADLILLSNTLENFSTIELISSIRNLSKSYKKTPIILLSSEAYKEDIKRFKKAGVTDVLTKPFDPEDMLSKIYNYLK